MLDKDYAIQLAMEYGFTGSFDAEGNLTYDSEFVEAMLEALQYEREACAKVCDAEFEKHRYSSDAIDCAIAIRARGEPTSRGTEA